MTPPLPPAVTPGETPLPQFLKTFAQIGLLSFGGPAAQISVMHRELVEDRRWMEEDGFLSALSFCMMLPGPEAMQLASYCGWRLRGVSGGVIAGLFFVLPGALVMLVLAALYARFGHFPLSEALFSGIKATVTLVVIQALLRLGKKALGRADRWALALAAFVLIAFFSIPFPFIVLGAAIYGAATAEITETSSFPAPKAIHLPRTLLICGTLWAMPLLGLWATGQERLLAIGLFFSRLAVVTFGGAYAVLAYMSQEVVTRQGWLTPEAMLDGLGLAESTPGPLILVTEFVGYIAATPLGLWGGIAGAAITLWVTFVPCFLWIFAGAPYIDWIATRPRLSAALKAITAAVVGVIASLSVWFTLHVVFEQTTLFQSGPVRVEIPVLSSLNSQALVLIVLAALLLFGLKRGLITTLALMALAGLGVQFVL